ncbi:hypothetical protein B0P06_001300 [Clostridium saccharoperbutylacetonicum]|uniref:Uncharacterized protein n=1 Tax=Clostridium saccharoperbutylacetonicum N1-4(HMT) TaxID=931276 RepID=M1LP57_9CLOT|nr:hypothetical protein Cspa_c08480 [Clostridium saccharoperbutylacetonicum N1-4(HMT)]NRT58854.1 hypothetical protein [Clostridium saccharoperbutylacetonicum]NSB28043.1 hypothetical protein [Clostridium saccharoperbutylacetonicum]NSB41529.1 hypothetical protein [Clostridium saccharoperbutylacetonicum]
MDPEIFNIKFRIVLRTLFIGAHLPFRTHVRKICTLEMAAMLHMRTFYAGEYDLFFILFLYTTQLDSLFYILSTDLTEL